MKCLAMVNLSSMFIRYLHFLPIPLKVPLIRQSIKSTYPDIFFLEFESFHVLCRVRPYRKNGVGLAVCSEGHINQGELMELQLSVSFFVPLSTWSDPIPSLKIQLLIPIRKLRGFKESQ